MRERQQGFTLIELMVTIAVISILAAIALPSFFGESRKARASAEVQPMFNDLRVRLEQFMQENGIYPDTLGEVDAAFYPPVQPPPVWDLTIDDDAHKLPLTWQAIKVRISGTDQLWCRYTWVTSRTGGVGPQAGNVQAGGVAFGFVAPATDWYYLLAKCDMDGQNDGLPDTFSWYFTSSVDAAIKKLNEGQ